MNAQEFRETVIRDLAEIKGALNTSNSVNTEKFKNVYWQIKLLYIIFLPVLGVVLATSIKLCFAAK